MKNQIIGSIVAFFLAVNIVFGYLSFAEPPDFNVNVLPSFVSLDPGEATTFDMTLSSIRGFESQVTLRVAELPEGVSATFDTNVTRLTSEENVTLTVTVKVDESASAGLRDLVIEANGDGIVHKATSAINIIGVGRVVVIIRDFWYYPDNVTVRKGTEVTWVNEDQVGHTATADNGDFNTELLRNNQQATVMFDKVGDNPYYCIPHPQMVGVVRVIK